MAGKLKSPGLIKRIGELAFGSAADAVKLAFIDPDMAERIDELDLRMVSEVKRGSNGTVEIKLLNRIALLELLARLVGPEAPKDEKGAESFFTAMDRAAARVCESGK